MSASPLGSSSFDDLSRRTDSSTPHARDSALLEKAIERAERILSVQDSLEAADVEAMKRVARQWQDQPLTLEPVAIELVGAILRAQFRDLAHWEPIWQQASREIARILWEDPTSRARLTALWSYLTGN